MAESAPPNSQPQPDFGISQQEMEGLRRQFLDEGEERCHRLLGGIGDGFDARNAARQMHQWVGSAGLLGFGEICKLARSLEQKLETQPLVISETRELLTNLALTFTDLRRPKLARIPDNIAKAIAGGRIAMVGFEASTPIGCARSWAAPAPGY